MADADDALPLHCLHCHGAVTLQLEGFDADGPGPTQSNTWLCPYCGKENVLNLRGRVVWVVRDDYEALRG